MRHLLPLVLSCLPAVLPAVLPSVLAAELSAEESEDYFVEANVLGIFYHELGHALIDIEAIPIFGQEEDAADVFSIFLIDALFEDEVAQEIAFDAAFGFWAESQLREAMGAVAWWGVHGADEQRFYNTVCLFFGANPDSRLEFAVALDLPVERAVTCPSEYARAAESWGAVLDDLMTRRFGSGLSFAGGDDSFAAEILRDEVDALNADLRLSAPVTVVVEPCGMANAFYDPQNRLIVFCTEFEDHLRDLWAAMN